MGTPDAKAHRKNDAKQRGLRQSLMSVRASLLKELDSKNKGKSEATSDDVAVQGIAYRSTASAPVVLSPTASTASCFVSDTVLYSFSFRVVQERPEQAGVQVVQHMDQKLFVELEQKGELWGRGHRSAEVFLQKEICLFPLPVL